MGTMQDMTSAINEGTTAILAQTAAMRSFNNGLTDAEKNLLKRIEKKILEDVQMLTRKISDQTKRL